MSEFEYVGRKVPQIITIRQYLVALTAMYNDILDERMYYFDHIGKFFAGYLESSDGKVKLANSNDTKAERFSCLYPSIILQDDFSDRIDTKSYDEILRSCTKEINALNYIRS